MITLPDGEVHLWWAAASEHDDQVVQNRQAAVLSRAEHAACDRLARATQRRAYVVSHALVRDVLSRYAPVAPRAWAFASNPHGKPDIAAPDAHRWLSFNLSHAGSAAVVAVARTLQVGVDIEAHAALPSAQAAAAVFLEPEEYRYVERDTAALLDLWTLKEAYLKACGTGVSIPLSSVRLNLDDPDRPRLAIGSAGRGPDCHAWLWRMRTQDHAVALAVLSGTGARFAVRQRTIVPLAPEHPS